MRSSSLCRLFGLTILLVLSHLICLGQQSATAGSLTGTVSDYTGAAIAGATVTVTDSATNQTRVSTSDEQGRYRFSSLRPDTYSVRSQAPGFEERGPRLVSVELGRSVVVDITLLPRGARYNVTVPVGQPEIDLTQTAAATSIDTESVEELPVNSRNYLQFALLAPGVAPSQNSSQTGTSTRSTSPLGDSGFTFGGLRARSNSIGFLANNFICGSSPAWPILKSPTMAGG